MAGINPRLRQRLTHLDSHIAAAMAQCNGKPAPDTGLMGKLVYVGCDSRERAVEVKRMLYRSASHHKVSLATDIVPADDGTFQVHFSVFHKSYGRKYVLDKYGSDRSKFPYDPRAKREAS
jgi:hypothetical protein